MSGQTPFIEVITETILLSLIFSSTVNLGSQFSVLSITSLRSNFPRPIGIEKFSIFPNSNVTYPAFIMEYLPFSSGAELNDLELNKAREFAKDEIVKTLDFGFMPGSDALNPNNFLYDRDNERSYLIDFEFWSYDNGNTICLTPKNIGDNQS